ncbi:MAG TPA: FkbM family methyltransferase [Rhodocyclaceae bacterium]|jgi:FkbM family methyltransferase|nr:FkbM family methyltransferase [Rhodocyclaceae bacterium]
MIDAARIIQSFTSDIPLAIRALVAQFSSGTVPRFLLGRNAESEVLSRLIDVDGFIDDFCQPGTTWQGKPVMRGSDVPRDAIVVNCVSNSKPRTAHMRIATHGIEKIISYADLCRSEPGRYPLLPFVEQTRNDLASNAAHWQALYDDLSDDTSRQVCNDILRYRLTGDYNVLAGYEYRPWDQYFEDFIGRKLDVFVDAGGYDGDTAEQFCKRYPDYRRVYLFEPSAANMIKARQRLSGVRDIEYVEQGVSDACGTLSFSSELGSASIVSTHGSVSIPVTTIDTYIKEPVSLIKMDLEGWELNSLRGAENHIRTDSPVLAISAYHHPSDFWRIREYIRGFGLSYDLLMRHYSESWTETVLYFVPR